MKTYIHERDDEAACQAGWSEFDTMAPDEVRHECNRRAGHAVSGNMTVHVCTCGLVDDVDGAE